MRKTKRAKKGGEKNPQNTSCVGMLLGGIFIGISVTVILYFVINKSYKKYIENTKNIETIYLQV